MPREGFNRTPRINAASLPVDTTLDALCMLTLQLPHCPRNVSSLSPTWKTEGLKGKAWNQKALFLSLKIRWKTALLGCVASSQFLPFSMRRPHHCFLNHVTCLASQIHSWRGIFTSRQDKAFLEPHLYVIYMIIQWRCEFLTLELRLKQLNMFGAVGMEGVCFACEKGKDLGGMGWHGTDWLQTTS